MPEFGSRDPLTPAFWDERFERDFTPWDRGAAPQVLHTFVARNDRPLRTLIPGCGKAWELVHLCEAGWPATAIDFSPAAVAQARQLAGQWADHIELADFFAWQPPHELDLIYERAFLCALPPAMWEKVAARWAELLPAGALLGGFFYFDAEAGKRGPPFATTPEALHALLDPHFELIEELAVTDSIPVFAGKERWMVWQRRAPAS